MTRFVLALVVALFLAKVLGGTPLAGALASTIAAADRFGWMLAGLVLAVAVAVVGRGVMTPGRAVAP